MSSIVFTRKGGCNLFPAIVIICSNSRFTLLSSTCSRSRFRRNLLTFQQNSALLNLWAIFTMAVTCLITMATLGMQPIWFTPSHLFWVHKLLYFVFVDIFHSLVIPLIMARTIPWECPKDESRESEFYVRQPGVLEPRQSISIHCAMGKSAASWMKTPSTAIMEPPTLVLPENTAPWTLPNSLGEGTLEQIPRLQKGCKSPSYCSFSMCRDRTSKVMPSGKKTVENSPHSVQKQDLLEWSCRNQITQGQIWKPGVIFPKQVFRWTPPRGETRTTERCLSSPAAEETKIWKGTNESGQNVLHYSRNLCT